MTVDVPALLTVLPALTAQGAGIAEAVEPAESVAADLRKAAHLIEALLKKAGIKNVKHQLIIPFQEGNPGLRKLPSMK